MALTPGGRASIPCRVQLWRSGIIWSALSFVSLLGNFVCISIIGHNLAPYPGEFGASYAALDFVTFLGLPLLMLNTSVIHYIAFFRARNDEERLQGLLAGCQKLLFWATVVGSLVAIALWEPLGRFFHFQRGSLMLAVLACGMVGWWSGLGVALCQGMAWFKRLAIIGVVAVGMRIIFLLAMTKPFPKAEVVLTSTTVAMLANFILFYWWKAIFRHSAQRISPWTREFGQFLLVTCATVAGTYFFSTGDSLVAKKYFGIGALDAYQAAARFGRAMSATAMPLLFVTFTSRSGSKEASAKTDQRILLGLYTVALACGAAVLIIFRNALMKLMLGHPNAEAAHMLIPFSIAMVLIGLDQAVGMWSLADRTFKIALLYGAMGLIYWLTLLTVGKTPATLLLAMQIGAGVSFCVLFGCWLTGRARRLRAVPRPV